MPKEPARTTSVSSRSGSLGGSPTEDGPRAPGPRPGNSVPMGGPPPIPERTTPGVGSIGRLSSASEIPEQPTDKAPTLSSVGRRDSQASQSSQTSSASRSQQSSSARPQSQSSVVEVQ